MQGRLTNKPVEEVIAAIQALDLESVKLRVMDPELGEGWSREYADSIEAAYKNYLTMLAKYQDDAEDIMLSKDVDEFWHTHILQTMKYADDCQKVFGTFLHHNPYIGERTPELLEKRATAAEKTRRLYQQEFGSVLSAEAAWSGQRGGAYCDAARTAKGAYCDVSVKENAAYCDAASRSAYCDASVQAQGAYCDASVTKHAHAYCDTTAHNQQRAYCDAALRLQSQAYCDASVDAERAAYCDAAVKPDAASYCDAAVRANEAAYCDAGAPHKKLG